MTKEKITGYYGPSDYHLIDLQAYPGHSGGPVWVAFPFATPEGRLSMTLFLLGSLVAGYPEPQEVVITPTKKGQKLSKKEYYNLGISLVTPAEKLVEILKSAQMEQKRAKHEQKPIKPMPVVLSARAVLSGSVQD